MNTEWPLYVRENATGVADFWRVYQAHYDELADHAVRRMREEPQFAPLMVHLTPEVLAADRAPGKRRLERAVAGDLTPLVENLRTQGAFFARLGIPMRNWHRLVRIVTRDLTPLLVSAWATEPARLADALLAMQSFFDWTLAEVAETYLRTSEEARQRSEARFRRLSEASFLGVLEIELPTLVLREANDAFLQMIGRSREELLAGTLRTSDFTPPEWHGTDDAALQEMQATRQSRPHEKEYLRPNGERVPVMVGGAKLDERTIIGFALDITQQKQLERFRARTLRLEVENRRIQEASRLKSEFLANMSHELRTPLNAIIGFTELIHSGQVTPGMPQYTEFLGDVLTSGRHLLQLINDVLDLSKVEAGRLEFHAEVVDLRKVVQEVLAILRTTAARKRLEVSSDIDPSLSTLLIDPSRLKQILYNYISNALKFTDEGGKVMVRAHPVEGGQFRLEVEDTGIGISSTDIPRLFSEFQQLDASSGKAQPGTGLGLALTKRLAEAQGGSVGVTSTPGKGSTFFALLPRTATTSESLPEPRSARGAPGAPAVLVIEDEPQDQSLIVRALTGAGYAVDTASTGAQALERCRARRFDAITLDLLLPDTTGLEVLKAIREGTQNRDVPVIVISIVTERGAAAGFTVHDILAKPVSSTAILASLQRAGVRSERAGQVLLVDDDETSTRLMSATLEQLGYRAVSVHSGLDGLTLASEVPPLAVVLDLLMPEMDGFEFLQRFRQLPGCKHVPVIVWSAKDLSPADFRQLETSVQGVLQKGQDAGTVILQALRSFLPVVAEL